jgi:hypothetical protein
MINSTEMRVLPEQLISTSLYAQMATVMRGPGELIPTPDEYFATGGGKILPFDTKGVDPQSILPVLENLDKISQRSTGYNDNLEGQRITGDTTAYEAEQLMEGSQRVLAYITNIFAEELRQILVLTHELIYQFQGNQGPLALWKRLHEGKQDAPRLYDALNGSYRITTSGVRDTQNRIVLQKRIMMLAQLLMGVPAFASDPDKVYTLLCKVLQRMGEHETERYLGTREAWIKQDGQQKQMQLQTMVMLAKLKQKQPADPAQVFGEKLATELGTTSGQVLAPVLAGELLQQLAPAMPQIDHQLAAMLVQELIGQGQGDQSAGMIQGAQPQGVQAPSVTA